MFNFFVLLIFLLLVWDWQTKIPKKGAVILKKINDSADRYWC